MKFTTLFLGCAALALSICANPSHLQAQLKPEAKSNPKSKQNPNACNLPSKPIFRLVLMEPTVTGDSASRTPADIRRVFAKHYKTLAKCVEKAQIESARTLVVRLLIHPDGKTLAAASIQGSTFPFEQCLLAHIKRFRFPAATKLQQIEMPLGFVEH